jgi:hypothetical protein
VKPYGYLVLGHFYPNENTANNAAWAMSMDAGQRLPITPVFLAGAAPAAAAQVSDAQWREKVLTRRPRWL